VTVRQPTVSFERRFELPRPPENRAKSEILDPIRVARLLQIRLRPARRPPPEAAMAALGDELVRHCWKLLHEGQPYRALLIAERALRLYQPPADSVLAGRLSLVVGVSLAALGQDGPARLYLEDASWSLANAGDEGAGEREPAEVAAD
jgi:hypothetical protein